MVIFMARNTNVPVTNEEALNKQKVKKADESMTTRAIR